MYLLATTTLERLKNIDFGKFFILILRTLFIWIDSVVYYFVNKFFQVYIYLAQFRLFDNIDFQDLIERTYIVVGVISLFMVAYALLNAIINPDNAGKGDKSLSKILKNLVFAIIGVAIVPTVFDYIYYFQKIILCNNVIPKILLSDNGGSEISDQNVGAEFATYLFQSFLYKNANYDSVTVEDTVEIPDEDGEKQTFTNYDLNQAFELSKQGYTFANIFSPFFSDDEASEKISYWFIASTIAGAFCAYVLASLCIDMGVRIFKLGYLQLIAPLPIMMLTVPGQKKIFDSWLKKTLSTFVEVFVRIFVITFVIYIASHLPDVLSESKFVEAICNGSDPGTFVMLTMRAMLYCGLLIFAKQAPKFFSEATGIKSDGWKLGIPDKLGEMALVGGTAKKGWNGAKDFMLKPFKKAYGGLSGGLGAVSTAIQNRKKIGVRDAFNQGFANGFDKGGNQFGKQRKATFQDIPEYNGKEQGLFGGVSHSQKLKDAHGKDVKKGYKDKSERIIRVEESSPDFENVKNSWVKQGLKDRDTKFKNSDIYKQAKEYAKSRMAALGVESPEIEQEAIANYLNGLKQKTDDESVKRMIVQHENDEKYSKAEETLKGGFSSVQDAINDYSNKFKQYQSEQTSVNLANDNIKKISSEIANLESQKQQLIATGASTDVIDNMTRQITQKNIELATNRSIVDNHQQLYNQLSATSQNIKAYVDATNANAEAIITGEGTVDMVTGADYLDKNLGIVKDAAFVKEYRDRKANSENVDKKKTDIDYLKEILEATKNNKGS